MTYKCPITPAFLIQRSLHIIGHQWQNNRAVSHGVGTSTTDLTSLQVARSRAAVRRCIIGDSSTLRRASKIVVVVVDALGDAVIVAGAWREWGGWCWTALVAEKVRDVHAREIEAGIET